MSFHFTLLSMSFIYVIQNFILNCVYCGIYSTSVLKNFDSTDHCDYQSTVKKSDVNFK